MSIDLDHLWMVASAANRDQPDRPWEWSGGYPQTITRIWGRGADRQHVRISRFPFDDRGVHRDIRPANRARAPLGRPAPGGRMKPRLLDLFCGAGGAAMGYARAGFEVWGVDIDTQSHYAGDRFHRDDAMRVLDSFWHPYPVWKISDFDAIHASPPCQAFTAYRRRGDGVGDGYPDLIAKVREELSCTGLPYVIENVAGSPLNNAVMLCGTGFGLDVQRHRYFESNVPLMSPGCSHGRNAARFAQATNRTNKRRTVEIGVWRIPLATQQRAMGIDWMTLEELSEAIPPVMTEHIGYYLLSEIAARAA